MRFLVATKETQGQRKNDFSHAREGELVKFGFECDGEEVDGNLERSVSRPIQRNDLFFRMIEMSSERFIIIMNYESGKMNYELDSDSMGT